MARTARSKTTGAGKGGGMHMAPTTSTGGESKVPRLAWGLGLAKITPLEQTRWNNQPTTFIYKIVKAFLNVYLKKLAAKLLWNGYCGCLG